MTDNERRIFLRGMSIASGLLINAQCQHRGVITAYQKALAEAWGIDDGDVAHSRGIHADGRRTERDHRGPRP